MHGGQGPDGVVRRVAGVVEHVMLVWVGTGTGHMGVVKQFHECICEGNASVVLCTISVAGNLVIHSEMKNTLLFCELCQEL